MKNSLALLMFLLLALSGFAMSNGTNDEPKPDQNVGIQQGVKADNNKITEEELHNIAVNFYTYMFEEEHEWKGIRVDSTESVIKNITPLKDGDITLAYIVNYNPDGHVFIIGYKSLYGPLGQHGGGIWTVGVEEGFLSIHDKRFYHPNQSGYYERLSEALKEKKVLTRPEDQKWWDKLNIPPEQFHERNNFDARASKPEWWLEKKKSGQR